MGNVSIDALAAVAILSQRVVYEYESDPTFVTIGGAIGLNVHGREVGRVTDRKDGGIDVAYYTPGNARDMPVFAERFG